MTSQTTKVKYQRAAGGADKTVALPAKTREGEPGQLSKAMAVTGRGEV